jgi:carboxypeptidase Taq
MSINPEQAYEELVRLSREETLLASCADLLEWDEEVFMPPHGVEHRAEQLAMLAGLSHDRGTNPRYDELLSALESSPLVGDPDSPISVNVRELRRGFDKERRMPRKLVEESARVTALASKAWAQARKKNNFKSFAPWLERIIGLAREEADAVGHNGTRYDALLDDYEPGMTTAQLSLLFDQLTSDLVPIVETSTDSSRRIPPKRFRIDRQQQFARRVAESVGFDFNRARIDNGQHPFCTVIGPGDVRIATRFFTSDLAHGIFTLLHEVGHALYDQGLDPEHYGTPMGEAASLGLHESQSRLWENFAGRSHGFWRYFYPEMQRLFPLRKISLEDFRRDVNRVEPGVIRVDADEVTYNLHIVIRFTLERALLDGDLSVTDLPGAWSELYQRYLAVTPDDDRSGCLQDAHWADGQFGYFPTYALGNVYAAQIFNAAERDLGSLDDAFAAGDFAGLRNWLGENVHRHGMRYRSHEIVERVSGTPPDASHLINHLSKRYLGTR